MNSRQAAERLKFTIANRLEIGRLRLLCRIGRRRHINCYPIRGYQAGRCWHCGRKAFR